jgi:hypothetical protein
VSHDRLPVAATNCRTVNFRTQYFLHYQAAGLPPPPGAKTTAEIIRKADAYLNTERGAAELSKLLSSSGARV